MGCIRAPLIDHQNTITERYEQRQAVLDRFPLHRHGGTLGRPATFRALAMRGIQTPAELVTLPYDQIQRLLPPILVDSAILLRQASRPLGQTKGGNAAQPHLMAEPARLVKAIRVGSVEESTLAGVRESCKRSMGLRDSFERLAPSAMAISLDTAVSGTPLLSCFLDVSAQLDVLQIVCSSLPSLAAGVQGRIDFCALIQEPPSPPLRS